MKHSSKLITNACAFIAVIVAELSYQSGGTVVRFILISKYCNFFLKRMMWKEMLFYAAVNLKYFNVGSIRTNMRQIKELN